MTTVWQSSRGKAISLLIGAYIIMTVMVGSCTVILKLCQNTLWRWLFQNPLKKHSEANVGKSAVVTVIVLTIMYPATRDASAKVQLQGVQVLYIWKLVMKKKFEM